MKNCALVFALVALAVLVGVGDLAACHKGCGKSSCGTPCGMKVGCCKPCAPCGPCCQPCAPAPCGPACAPCSGGACKVSASATGDRAILVVNLPADARLTIQDKPTASTSSRRVFQSPALEAGKEYVYTLKASAVRDGKTVEVVKEVTVRAGSEVSVDLDLGAPAVASK